MEGFSFLLEGVTVALTVAGSAAASEEEEGLLFFPEDEVFPLLAAVNFLYNLNRSLLKFPVMGSNELNSTTYTNINW